MEDINLHFTGDFNAIALANNLAATVLDNHIHHGNTLDVDPRRIHIRRVVDLNDRALRNTTIGLGGINGGVRGRTTSTSSSPAKSWRSSAWPRASPTSGSG